jgi:2-dehydropantoate 2-reductase
VLSCKAYDLDGAMDSVAPAVGPGTMVLPLLNGMAQMDRLAARFGTEAVLGGLCFISTTLDGQGRILHLNDTHQLVFGEAGGGSSARAEAVLEQFSGTGFDVRRSDAILQDMWEKWVFIATLAGITCLMRATIGDIAAAGGAGLASGLLDECAAIAAGHGHAPSAEYLERSRTLVTQPGSAMAASMLRDLERGGPVEADHMIADMLARAGGRPSPLLGTALAHLKSYEARRAREAQAG